MEFEIDKRAGVSVRIDRKRKLPVTVFLRALAGIDSEATKDEPGLLSEGTDEEILELFDNNPFIKATLEKDSVSSVDEALVELFKKQRPGEKQSGRKPQATGKAARKDSGKVPNTRSGKEKPPPAKIAGPLTEKKGTVGWGFLPGEARALLDGSRRTGIPAKYAEMIRRYFERLSTGAKRK